MKSVPIEEWRTLTAPELEHKIRSTNDELYKLRCAERQGTLEKTHQIRLLRRNLARLNTLWREKTRGAT